MSRIGVKKWNPVGKMDWPEIHAFKRELHDLGIWNPYKWSPVCKMNDDEFIHFCRELESLSLVHTEQEMTLFVVFSAFCKAYAERGYSQAEAFSVLSGGSRN
jgi:hypothetical protein